MIAELAYLGQMLQASGTMATLRDLADYGATLCFDDAENVMDVKKGDPEKRTLLLAGNRQGSCITVKEQVGNGQWKTRYVQTFCPRLFSAIRLPDPVLASRTIIVPLIRTADPEKANADPCDYRLWPFSRTSLVNDLWALALCHMAELPRYDALVADTAMLLGRNLEPWRAILAVAHWLTDKGVDGLADRLTTLAHAYQEERRELEPPDLTAWTIQALGNCCTKCTTSLGADEELFAAAPGAPSAPSAPSVERLPVWTLETSVIAEEVKRLLEEAQTELKTESISSNRIGKILKALRLEKADREKRGEARKWKVTRDDLLTHLVTYGLSLPEKIFPQNPSPSSLGALGADQDTSVSTPDAAPSDSKNAEGLQTLGALGAPGDLVQGHCNGSAAPLAAGDAPVCCYPHLNDAEICPDCGQDEQGRRATFAEALVTLLQSSKGGCPTPDCAGWVCCHCHKTAYWHNVGNEPICSRCHPQPVNHGSNNHHAN